MPGIYSAHDAIIGVQGATGGRGGGLRYLLRDEFTTDRAAGAVDGTAAEPGPGTRTVVDTGSDVSIASDVLVIAGGAGAWSDPRITYTPTLAERSGYGLGAQCEIAVTSGKIAFGMADGAGATPTGVFFRIDGTTLEVVDGAAVNAAATATIGTITGSTPYYLAINKRSSMTEYYIYGGAEYTDWTCVHRGAALAVDPVVVGIWNYDAVAEVTS